MTEFNLHQIARKNILELTPYRCARDDYSEGILLDANENSVGAAVSSYPDLALNRYPDPMHYDLKQRIAEFRGVQKSQIFLGVGSDEAIDVLFRIFCYPTIDNVIITPPTYGMYKVCAKVNDVAVKIAPLTSTFDVDEDTLFKTIDSNTKMIFICSPGNPTSKSIALEVIERIAKSYKTGILVVDEAYVDFSTVSSACSILNQYPNIVILQTLSKAFGLAGIRLGMAIASEEIIQLMNNVKAPYNINKLTVQVALEAFRDLSLFQHHKNLILQERTYLNNKLLSSKYVHKVFASDANFILFQISNAQEIYQLMANQGIVCRYRGTEMHCDNCLRVTIGTRAENDQFFALLEQIAQSLE